MADAKISTLTSILGAAVASGDQVELLDISDASMGASGTNKRITAAELATALASLGGLATTAAVAAGYQPLDSDLTAIAALSTTTFGRSLLTQADASAARSALSLGTAATVNTGTGASDVPTKTQADGLYQPLDSDLTAIAALSTTAYGRALLALANLAALQAVLGTGTPSSSTFLRGDGTWSTPTAAATFQGDYPSAQAVSGAYYMPEGHGGAMTNTNGGLNALVVTPILLAAGTLDRIGIYHAASPTASEVARLGIYNSTATGLPSTLVVDAGTVDLSTAAAYKEITISQSVTAGLYWLACARQGPTSTATVACWLGLAAANQHSFLTGINLPLSSPSGGIWNRISFYRVASVSGALPATPTFVGNTNNDANYPTWGVAVRYA